MSAFSMGLTSCRNCPIEQSTLVGYDVCIMWKDRISLVLKPVSTYAGYSDSCTMMHTLIKFALGRLAHFVLCLLAHFKLVRPATKITLRDPYVDEEVQGSAFRIRAIIV